MASWNIAVVGATGLVGSAIVDLLQERSFPVAEVHLLASENSVGEQVRFNGTNLKMASIADFDWSLVSMAFFAAGEKVTEQYAQDAADSGCVVIDTSGYFSAQPHIPLITPQVNNTVLADYRNGNIVAIANSIVSQLLRAVTAITEGQEITHIHVSSFIPASFYGKAGIDELAGQSARLLNGLAVENNLFAKQLAFNLLPIADAQHEDGTLEQCVIEQCRRILANELLPISTDFINAPVFYGLAQSVNMTVQYPMAIDHIQEKLSYNNDIILSDSDDLPTPVTELNSPLNLKIGNVRYSYGIPEQLQLWSVSDNIRYLGALMAVETAELLVNEYL